MNTECIWPVCEKKHPKKQHPKVRLRHQDPRPGLAPAPRAGAGAESREMGRLALSASSNTTAGRLKRSLSVQLQVLGNATVCRSCVPNVMSWNN